MSDVLHREVVTYPDLMGDGLLKLVERIKPVAAQFMQGEAVLHEAVPELHANGEVSVLYTGTEPLMGVDRILCNNADGKTIFTILCNQYETGISKGDSISAVFIETGRH